MSYTIYTDPPQSRNEAILKSAIDGTQYTDPPQSRIEDLLKELKAAIEGGGGGGTTNYNALENRPQVNGHTLEGDMSFEDLGIDETPTEDSANAVASGGVYAGLADKIDKSSTGYQTITGNPLEFDSPSPQMVSMKCDIVASQDLHGYDKPWAGGEGKNRLPSPVSQTKDGVTLSIDSEGYIVANGTATKDTVDIYFAQNIPMEAGSYKSVLIKSDANDIRLFVLENGTIRNEDIVFSEANDFMLDIAFLRFFGGTTYQNARCGAMIVEATETDPTFEPYSNICPIEGTDTIDIDVGGKNRLYLTNTETTSESGITITAHYEDSKLCGYELSGTSEAQVDYSALHGYGSTSTTIPSGSYKLTCDGLVNGIEIHVGYGGDTLAQMTTSEEVNIEAPNGVAWLIVRVKNGIALDNATIKPMIRLATETNPTFEPYVNESYTIDLDGTRYGGQLDVGSGVLTLTHGEIASYDGETLPSEWISDRDEYQAGTTPTTGAQVVYELATPQTVQLTPTQVWAVQGGNTITVSVDGVEAEIHSSNYATLQDINDLWDYIKQSPQGSSDGVKFGASNLEMIGGTMA